MVVVLVNGETQEEEEIFESFSPAMCQAGGGCFKKINKKKQNKKGKEEEEMISSLPTHTSRFVYFFF